MPSSTVKAAHIITNHKIGPSVEHNSGLKLPAFQPKEMYWLPVVKAT